MILVGFDVTAQINGLADDEDDRQSHHAEQFEVDPVVVAEMARERHVEIDRADRREEDDPTPVEAGPDPVRQADIVRHHPLQDRFGTDVLAEEKRHREQPVYYGGFPFDKCFILQQQCCAAQRHGQPQGHPVQGIDAAMAQPRPADLHDGADHQRGGGDEDIV